VFDRTAILIPARGLIRIAGAGAVNQDTFLTDDSTRFGKSGVDVGVAGDIYFAENTAEFFSDSLALRFVHVEDCDFHAVACERACCGFAETRCATGDDSGD
jgi:hypothetical protein